MYKDTLDTLNDQASGKLDLYKESPFKYFLASMLAGAYLGVGSVVLFSVGEPLDAADSPFLDIMTGATFGVALALVLWAGSELFTGNNLIFTVSALSKVTSWTETLTIWVWSYIGNLTGALIFSVLVLWSGIYAEFGADSFMMSTAAEKMNAPMFELFIRGVLCNWIVCLAIWTSLRAEGDMAKLFLIFILIFAFIATGFEHVVANMSLLAIPLFHGGIEEVTIGGFIYNMVPVTIGNILGGGIFVAMTYFFISQKKA